MGFAPSVNSMLGQRVVVSVGDLAVLDEKGGKISTFGVGMCLGVVVYEPCSSVGGIIHIMLPDSTLSPEKSEAKPGMFADTAIPKILGEIESRGGDLKDVRVLLAGGAETLSQNDVFKVGEKNVAVVKELLKASGVGEPLEELGGRDNRTLHLKIGSGEVQVKTSGGSKTLILK